MFPNGAVYAGEWAMLQPPPNTVLSDDYANPHMDYSGQPTFNRKQRHGFGRYQHGRELYIGGWLHDEMHGKGRLEMLGNGCYEGEWVHGKFQGRGSYSWPSGAWYSGDWVQNKMHGNGVFVTSEGHRFQGRFHNDYFVNREGDWVPLSTDYSQDK